jgi:hypothetical protein
MTDRDNPFADGCTVIRCYGNAKPADKHLASTIHCVDEEITLPSSARRVDR